MSALDFFDVFRMFLGELDNRGYDDHARQEILQGVVVSLKNVLSQQAQIRTVYAANAFAVSPTSAPQVAYTYAAPVPVAQPQPQYQQPPQPQYQQPPQPQYQQPPPQAQPQYQQPQQQAYQQPQQQQPAAYQQLQHYQEPEPEPVQQQQPPPQEEPQYQQQQADDSGAEDDQSIRASISAAVYGTGLRLQNVFKTMNSEGTGLTEQQLVEGLQKLGVHVRSDAVLRLSLPFFANGRLSYSGFIRLLADPK